MKKKYSTHDQLNRKITLTSIPDDKNSQTRIYYDGKENRTIEALLIWGL